MGAAHAQQAFSNAWFAARGAAQATASQTGRLPNGMPVTSLMDPSAQQQQANAQLQRSIANLGTAAQNIAAMQAAQANARAAAGNTDATIPDGLSEGGLKVDTNSLTKGWVNAQAPTQTSANGKTNVNIAQTADKAILNWETFNVGRNTSVNFAQQSDWAALNRVNDPNARPSQIQGQIHGDGTVLILNRNGVIFGGTSQVDTRNLVVAAARMSDAQFQTGGIYGANGTTPSFTDALGKVEVQAGANITTRTPTSVTQGGGYVLLLGNQVSNAGAIVTPQGQVALAAGDSFVIRKGVGTDANTASTTRGNEISPQFVAQSTAGKVVNTGLLMASEGDITLAGRDVQQLGTAVSTTTVNTRGTIHLLNSASDTQGKVTLGSGALTSVLISDSGATALDSQRTALIQDSATQDALRAGTSSGLFDNLSKLSDRRDQSRVEIVSGGNVEFQSDSLTLATGGQIAVSATGRSFVANRAQLDVSGAVGVSLSMDSNNVKVNVQGNEQRDAPGNRDNAALNNANVWIDRRRLVYVPASVGGYANERWYTPGGLLEVGGYLANQAHGIGEWAAQGGTVTIGGNEVVTQKGALINLSGGSLDVQTGYLNQSWLKGADGQLYNVNTAPSNVLYTGVYNGFEVDHPRWGKNTTESYASPLIAPTRVLQNGYTVGRDAGKLIVNAPTAVLEADVTATVYTGPVQTQARPSSLTDGYALSQFTVARAGSLALGQYSNLGRINGYASDVVIGAFDDITQGMAAGDALDTARNGTVWMDAGRLNSAGLGELDLVSTHRIAVNGDLNLATGGRLSLIAPRVDVNGDVTARGGIVNVTNLFLKAGDTFPTPLLTPDNVAVLTLGPNRTIDVRGVWVNGALDPNSLSQVAYLNGGNVTFDSTGDLTIDTGSVIDVSSGGAVLANGKTRGGTGGNVTLIAGDAAANFSRGTLVLDGTIKAYGVNGGGKLTISTPDSIMIGSNAGLAGGSLASGTASEVALKLAEPYTVPAGTPLPFSAVDGRTRLTLDVPTPTDITSDGGPSTPTAAPWVVPTGVTVMVTRPKGQLGWDRYYSGDTLPAGTVIFALDNSGVIPAGTVIPSSVFPNGFPIKPYSVVYTAGTVSGTDVTYPVGTILPAGTVLARTVAVAPVPSFSAGNSGSNAPFFSAGFSSYDINGGQGVHIDKGVTLAPTMPVYRFTANSMNARTGSDPAQAMTLTLPPLFAENASAGTLTQRGGASLALRALKKDYLGNPSGADIVVSPQASIIVDPGQSITLDAFEQITVDGSLSARGGKINLVNEGDGSLPNTRIFDDSGANRGVSVWLGPQAMLDVSGLGYTATDANGRTYGTVLDGGAININGGTAFVVLRPGAQMNADGVSVSVDTATVSGQPANARGTTALVSNGGSIALTSMSGLALDGDMHARAGGAGASGGDLSLTLITLQFWDPLGQTPLSQRPVSMMMLTQTRPDPVALSGPGAPVSVLPVGRGVISVDQIKSGGFSSLSLTSTDYLNFNGDVSLSLDKSLRLNAGEYVSGMPLVAGESPTDHPGHGNVRLSAPYVLLSATPFTLPDGYVSGSLGNPNASARPTTATFEIDANLIDVKGPVVFSSRSSYYDSDQYVNVDTSAPGFRSVKLVSQGDIRFLASPNATNGTVLASSWDIALDGAQIYPATGAVATVTAGQSNSNYTDATLSIGRTTDTVPDTPYSAFGTLSLVAPNIRQGGILRAPFGKLLMGVPAVGGVLTGSTSNIEFLPGSLTSASLNGLVMPYGGTVDGVTYTYNGATIPGYLTELSLDSRLLGAGMLLQSKTIRVDENAVLDLSGGGTLTGAGFVSGRGGSVNVLNTPLVNANPTMTLSKAGNTVYAILPGYASNYAPVAAENGAGDPVVGQRITLGEGVPGLAAGTYTLLPSNYALLPGAYRVEIGGTVGNLPATATAAGNGTYLVPGYTSVANTAIRSQLPSSVLVTPGTAVRKYSQYNEQSYSDFVTSQVAQFGGVAPMLPRDGSALAIRFNLSDTPDTPSPYPALVFDGRALFQPAAGGTAGQVGVFNIGEITNGDISPGFTGVSVTGQALSALGAPRLSVNGKVGLANGVLGFEQAPASGDLAVRDGVTLTAGEIYLVGGNIDIGRDVTLSTVGQGPARFDTASTGYKFSAGNATVLGLSNGDLQFVGSSGGSGAINIGAGAGLFAEGTVALATNGASSIDPDARFGARNIALAVGTLNVGDAAQIVAAGNPAGVLFNQSVLNTLLQGDSTHGAPALQRLTLSTANAINLFGSNGLDTRGKGVDLVLNSPAIYGTGAAGDRAVVAADRIVWNGVQGGGAPAITAGGPGTGSGSLQFVAREIDIGEPVTLDTSNVNRTMYGFNSVDFSASERIVSAGRGALYVYQAPSTQAGDVLGQSGTGGNLTLSTPLLTGAAKSIINYTTGGTLTVVTPAGVAPSVATTTVAGAEIDLSGNNVNIGSAVLLPSGKFVVNAVNDIVLDGNSRIDLRGRPTTIQSATVYGFGGSAVLRSMQGSVSQLAGSVVDVSATHANAGAISIDAATGTLSLGGSVLGAADEGFTSGAFGASVSTFSDFSGLNALLTRGGFFDSRSFDQKRGDLVVGDGVKAHNVGIAVDSGMLTVNGTIDASGAQPGTIRLSGGNGLMLGSSAVLDAHGTQLQVDSYGAPIEAKNRGHVELTAAGGTLTLSPGATIDLSTPGATHYGDVILNAMRTAETSGDVAIDAAGPLAIRGANSIALNGVWTYTLPSGSVVTQSTLDDYDTASTAFMNQAQGNAALGARTAGLAAYGSAYHLRPGVQIASLGDLSTAGDIDLAKYRYGAGADRDPASATYGAGEPMALILRAAGNLAINGSISDGFTGTGAGAPAFSAITPATFSTDTSHFGKQGAYLWRLSAGNTMVVSNPNGWLVPQYGPARNLALPPSVQPTALDGTQYPSGSVVPFGTILTRLYVPVGSEIPSAASLSLQTDPGTPAASATSARASLLAPGMLSASLRLVAGADLSGADQRALQSVPTLGGSGNLTLSDSAYDASQKGTFFSVLRTGTGSLELLAGNSFSEATPYGVYTAGTQAAPILAADGRNPYNLPGAATSGVLQAWYPEHGGDLLLMAQQDVSGNIQLADNPVRYVNSNQVGNWLNRQGGGGATNDPAAWSINFGSLAKTDPNATDLQLIGFQGIGTLGGGNLTVIAGRDAGAIAVPDTSGTTSTGLDLAVASTGRVLSDGTLVQTGGGDLTLKVGRQLNGADPSTSRDFRRDYFGSLTALRGDTSVESGAVGVIAPQIRGVVWTTYDPRAPEPNAIKLTMRTPGPTVLVGDGAANIVARGDLVLAGAGDAGMSLFSDKGGGYYTSVAAGSGVASVVKGGYSRFTLWTPGTSLRLLSAGGDVSPLSGTGSGDASNALGFYPGSLSAVSLNGDIRFGEGQTIELMPSPIGQLQVLAAGTIYGAGSTIAMSGADLASLATPLHPVFTTMEGFTANSLTNASANAAQRINWASPLAFGEDYPSGSLHAPDGAPAQIYAGTDIDDLQIGMTTVVNLGPASGFTPSHARWFVAGKPVEVIAGRDIVGTGTLPSTFLNQSDSDVSLMQAGRDIIYQSANIVGPGLLQIQAGRNVYQGYYGQLQSMGDVAHPSNTNGGAGISVLAGVGANGPDYSRFARLYFDPANQLASGLPLADSGKVVHAYGDELVAWLKRRFGYDGNASDALSYFLSLPQIQQGVFVRQVYFKELLLGGREYNDASSPRYGSYLRGREAIATLFPTSDAQGNPLSYSGAITLFSSVTGSTTVNGKPVPVTTDATVRTNFGGDIQMLNPGGRMLVGVEGVTPGAAAGVVTQGDGDIQLYSRDSILLGLSRVMTTFGGSIQAWSAQGDINAGRGAKTTVLYTPPRRVYDDSGNVTLSASVPSSGAGIATLAPLPEVPPGDVDLVAPLGTIDAGEAGVRVSGNVNFAALAVVNAANVQVQGKSTGLPVIAAVNVGALTNASATAAQAASAAQDAMARERVTQRQNLPSIFSVRMLSTGGGATDGTAGSDTPAGSRAPGPLGYDRSSLLQLVGSGNQLDPRQLARLTDEERRALNTH
ncbi:hypothetical protein AT395_24550 [Pandoraea apista]|nr:hypothetical protein AT395_24550 [Pandoraea apista]